MVSPSVSEHFAGSIAINKSRKKKKTDDHRLLRIIMYTVAVVIHRSTGGDRKINVRFGKRSVSVRILVVVKLRRLQARGVRSARTAHYNSRRTVDVRV